jgi:serine/threonine protein phosphatase PrpC
MAANEAGGRDNVTVVVVDIDSDGDGADETTLPREVLSRAMPPGGRTIAGWSRLTSDRVPHCDISRLWFTIPP